MPRIPPALRRVAGSPPGVALGGVALGGVALAAAGCGDDPARLPAPSPWDLDSAAFVLTATVREGNTDLFLVDHPADARWTRLTLSPGLDSDPTWSPDGRRLAFHSDRDATGGEGGLDVYVMELDGEPGPGRPPEVTNLTNHPGHDYLPDWSPDGRHIAFLSRRAEPDAPLGSPGHLYLMDADGSNPRRITRLPLGASLGPRWTPDGRALLFARRVRPDGPTHLFRIELPRAALATGPAAQPDRTPIGGAETRLVADTFFNYAPAPSPDGRLLAYTAEGDAAARVVVVNADGTDPRVVLDEGYHYVDGWTPDGRWIVATRWYPAFQRTEAWLLSPDGHAPHRTVQAPVTRPDGGVAFRPPSSDPVP